MPAMKPGLCAGVLIGAAGAAIASQIVNAPGRLDGWTVMQDGEPVCEAPYVHVATRQIECEGETYHVHTPQHPAPVTATRHAVAGR